MIVGHSAGARAGLWVRVSLVAAMGAHLGCGGRAEEVTLPGPAGVLKPAQSRLPHGDAERDHQKILTGLQLTRMDVTAIDGPFLVQGCTLAYDGKRINDVFVGSICASSAEEFAESVKRWKEKLGEAHDNDPDVVADRAWKNLVDNASSYMTNAAEAAAIGLKDDTWQCVDELQAIRRDMRRTLAKNECERATKAPDDDAIAGLLAELATSRELASEILDPAAGDGAIAERAMTAWGRLSQRTQPAPSRGQDEPWDAIRAETVARVRSFAAWYDQHFGGITAAQLKSSRKDVLAKLDKKTELLKAVLIGRQDGDACLQAAFNASDALMNLEGWDTDVKACTARLHTAVETRKARR
jgi:hypothetical protein